MSHAGQRALVLGLGRSGRAALALLQRHGARVSVYDRDATRLEGLPDGVERLSGPELPDFDGFDRVIASPGVPAPPHPRLEPEIDLAARHLEAPVVGVTGTNGKSTSAVMIGEMLRRSGLAVPIGGNLGDPLCALAGVPADHVVAELSSFQLEHARVLHVSTGVLLNLAPDHLDRHGSLAAYAAAKARIARLQHPGDVLIVNRDDPWALRTGRSAAGRTLEFSREPLENGACLDGKDLVLRDAGSEVLRVPREQLAPACRTPLANALASMLAAHVAGAAPEAIRGLLESFAGLPHRAQVVAVRRGVRYVDDSKATNPAAAAASLAAQPRGTVWIAGGRNKGLDFTPLAEAAHGLRIAILLGEARGELAAALRETVEVREVETLAEAVRAAAGKARPGATVLLAPACSSFDQFASFEERGRHFAELARALPEETRC